jgi:streptogramin lyase
VTNDPEHQTLSTMPCSFPSTIHLTVIALGLAPLGLAHAGVIETVAGTGGAGDNGSQGVARQINIGEPFGVEIGPDGGLYVTEVRNHRVLRVDLAAGKIATVAGNGRKGHSGDGGQATAASLNEPYEVRFDRGGNMVFVEMQNHIIRRVDAKTGIITTLAGTGKAGFGGDGGPATKAQFRQPHSIAVGPQGHVYVVDTENQAIRKIDVAQGTVTTVAGNGQKGGAGDGGPATKAQLARPHGICVGPDGAIYIGDTLNHRVRRVKE